jgi:FtsP/CotA-like multicopper oxidase with cupredoxin domain
MGMGMMGAGRMAFTINGRLFDPDRVDTKAELDRIEDWEFVNFSTMDHPMHVHTNPFQVIDSDGLPARAWKDVVLVPMRSRVRVRTAFRDFVGPTMYHCHILDHEDLGMMGVLQIGTGGS